MVPGILGMIGADEIDTMMMDLGGIRGVHRDGSDLKWCRWWIVERVLNASRVVLLAEKGDEGPHTRRLALKLMSEQEVCKMDRDMKAITALRVSDVDHMVN